MRVQAPPSSHLRAREGMLFSAWNNCWPSYCVQEAAKSAQDASKCAMTAAKMPLRRVQRSKLAADRPRVLSESLLGIDTSNKSAMSWIRWSHDCMCRGQYEDAKEMLRKGLELAKKEKTNGNNN